MKMQYRTDKKGNKISVLGYGCLRFKKKNGKIDLERTEKQILAAIERGVNYFDTAYVYGGSEAALGTILARNNCRDKVYIATKLPHYLIKSVEGMEKLFQEELKRLKTDHIDYYLMHMLTDVATWEKLKELGIEEWIQGKLDSGQIRQIGFSYHGNSKMFCQLVDAYDWDFVQIQYNYMDENSQAGRKGLQYAHSKGLPVIIMEPLRGGRLVELLPQSAKAFMADNYRQWSPADWAFHWLWNQEEVTCVLSGMNTLRMVKENVRSACLSKVGEFTDSDYALIELVKAKINSSMKVGCTGCGYCLPCPKGVDIPGTFRTYNEIYSEKRSSAQKEYMQCTIFRNHPSSASQCIGCGRCEKHCPQSIHIREELKNAVQELETPLYKVASKVIKIFRLW
jgi:hypothetical protein